MMKRWGSLGIGTLAGAFLLGGSLLFAAPSAQADLLESAEFIACEFYSELLGVGELVCDFWECDPSADDCDKVCGAIKKGCRKEGQKAKEAANQVCDAFKKEGKTLCNTADDKSACKEDVSEAGKDCRNFSKALGSETKDECSEADLAAECKDVCLGGELFEDLILAIWGELLCEDLAL
jgi:hypothetical protein